ncbi:RHS repeat-associated core domain-containing protein [Desulfitobacterium sp. THU1]|uniref:RHS repeat-associated core domain-containing protein n=1 Tax=Desulfitobacterium sp. THU1 TaxID=3138072 RepID=UPI00311E786F
MSNLGQAFFDEKGSIIRVKQGATSIYQDYDDAARLKSQTVTGSANLEINYGYNANGQVQSYTEKVGGISVHQTFVYDFAKRLTSWTKTGQNAVTFNYDKAGNLLTPHGHAYTFNDANEINGFTYDQAGNLRQDNKYNYEWNGHGQLTAVKNKGTGSVIASYTYHPDGLRKSKATGGVTYNYHYDGTNLIRVTSNNATVYAFTWANGKPVSLTDSTGTTYYYVTNYRGDVVRIVDAVGNSVADYSYDPWGIVTVGGSSAVKDQPIRYASYVQDTETNLYYLQARYYDPDSARFISRDPHGGTLDNPLSQNAYAYANGDPVNNVDPDGRMATVLALGGSGLGVAYGTGTALSWNPVGWVILGGAAVATAGLMYMAKQSGKEKANDVPSWAKGKRPNPGENGNDFAKRLCDEKYGPGNYLTGPGSEYNKLRKWGDRGFK